MYSEQDTQKMQAFIKRLTLNPCFANETPLAVEENIILFFLQNYNALRNTFTTPDYFPNMQWFEIENLFFKVLVDEVNLKLNSMIEKLLHGKINLGFMNTLLKRQINVMNFENQLLKIILKLLERFEIRRKFDPILKLINRGIVDAYIKEIFEKRSYTAREIERVEKLKLDPSEIPHYLKVMLLLSSLAYIRTDLDNASIHQKINVGEVKYPNLHSRLNFYKQITNEYTPELNLFPPDYIEKSLKSHMSFAEDEFLPATCRLSKIFYFYGKSFKPNVKVDKGAETFGKSWFQIQRRNYKFYGFDNGILEELYRIAAENYW